ncbi:hypothetical protein NC652_013718 [Populus alba x Populus x berolinensis]|nr:hypothetical protein NC652_013718 [Populus alba x Populus x berolinensis]
MELVKPTGWVYLSLSGNDPRETFVNTFMLQIAVLSNHLNGRDTHVRQIKVYGPRPCVFHLSVHNLLSFVHQFLITTFSIYFKRVHYVLLCEMRNMTLPTKEKNCETVSRGEAKHWRPSYQQAQACQQQSQESQRSSRFQGFLAQPPGKGKREKPNEGTSNISEQGKKDMKQATKRSFK